MTDKMLTAEKLLQINAVKLNTEQPFTWASGWRSPIYCDNRRILSFPYVRDYIKSELSNVVFQQFAGAESISGVATAGIPWGALVADALKLPFGYVRASPKEHGLQNRIEGSADALQNTVVIEDLISTGISSLEVVNALKSAGIKVVGLVSIFNYGFELAQQRFAEAGVPVFSLTDYPSLIQLAETKGSVRPEDKDQLLKWRESPHTWTGKM